MSAEPTKKRGRPRKIVDSDARAVSATSARKTVTTKAAAKKSAKKTVPAPGAEQSSTITAGKDESVDDDGQRTKNAQPARYSLPVDEPRKRPTIAEQSTAFQHVKAAPQDSVAAAVPESADKVVSKGEISHDMQTARSQPDPTPKSSFLDSFLDDKLSDSPPVVEDNAVISDRSAFRKSEPSINDIVFGQGVSDTNAFASQQTISASTRPSSIPIRQPKSFTGHKVAKFDAETKPAALPRPQVDPASFAVASFASFKVWPQQQTPGTTSAEQRTPKEPPVASQVDPSLATERRFTARLPALSTASGTNTEMGSAGLRTIAPAQRADIFTSPAYKKRMRQWTGLIVGIPVLIVTTYVLGPRLWPQPDILDAAATSQRSRGMLQLGEMDVSNPDSGDS